MAGTGSTRDSSSQGCKDQQAVGKERKALPTLSSVRHSESRNEEAEKAVNEKARSNKVRKDNHNMTFDHLDIIVNRVGDVSGERAGAELRPCGTNFVVGDDPCGVQGLAKSGGVSGRNSLLFWD